MKNLLILSLLSLPIAFGACTAEAKKEPTTNEQPANEGGKQAMAEAAEYDVKCGCSIEGIGHCDPFIMIDGKYVPLVHPKVGKMEFCAQPRDEAGNRAQSNESFRIEEGVIAAGETPYSVGAAPRTG